MDYPDNCTLDNAAYLICRKVYADGPNFTPYRISQHHSLLSEFRQLYPDRCQDGEEDNIVIMNSFKRAMADMVHEALDRLT